MAREPALPATGPTLEWLVSPEGGIQFGLRVAVIVGASPGLLIVARISRGSARRLFSRVPDLSKLLQGFRVVALRGCAGPGIGVMAPAG